MGNQIIQKPNVGNLTSEISIFLRVSHTLYCIADHIRQFFGFCGPTRGGYVKIRDLKRPVAFRILSVSSSRVFFATFELVGKRFTQKIIFEN